ncbi:hypothetical protein CERZMDRAFT_95439 [Cercospora zeae-maydis SCOH1-5]|uniref:Uncharacterized protein n=1 Tax=Cercospora zeae-maydis SCOH1-5 TaxID=717836 RepID=A0A6A6FPF5_9PEZI|nr:hypothetical protein CERZMDRAFT_95439 [Cercospora zeae-maydis SCOH1-5]
MQVRTGIGVQPTCEGFVYALHTALTGEARPASIAPMLSHEQDARVHKWALHRPTDRCPRTYIGSISPTFLLHYLLGKFGSLVRQPTSAYHQPRRHIWLTSRTVLASHQYVEQRDWHIRAKDTEATDRLLNSLRQAGPNADTGIGSKANRILRVPADPHWESAS